MILKVDSETHGYYKDYENLWELFQAMFEELDKDVIEVSIKKRPVKDNDSCVENTL